MSQSAKRTKIKQHFRFDPAMRFDFFDLQLFINILSTGSLTKGAERSAISLQAASERIKKLEHHFEVSLFTRHATGEKRPLLDKPLRNMRSTCCNNNSNYNRPCCPLPTVQRVTLYCGATHRHRVSTYRTCCRSI